MWGVTWVLMVVVVVGVGVYDIIYNVEPNMCAMTWMYEYPRFISITMPNNITARFPKYSLYVYGEGVYAQRLRNDLRLTGIPVLFVHGNAGSYKQVRSPASVSLRKSESRAYEFNYFTVDYGEELSALYGHFLYRQREYLHHAVRQIFTLYAHLPKELRPKSVITICHSMGGLVVRGLFTLPDFDASQISTVITLATPQTKSPLPLDAFTERFYSDVNDYWRKEGNNSLRNVTFVSLGGGFRDYLVRSDLCHMDGFTSMSTDSIPHIWRSTDHQCIVWCNELVRALTRCFFKMVSPKTKQIVGNHKRRVRIVNNVLFHRAFQNQKPPQNNCTEININNQSFYQFSDATCIKINSKLENVKLWTNNTAKGWLLRCSSNSCCVPDFTVVPRGLTPSYFYEPRASEDLLVTKKVLLIQKHNISLSLETPWLFRSESEFEIKQQSFYVEMKLEGFMETWQAYKMTVIVNHDPQQERTVAVTAAWTQDEKFFILESENSTMLMKHFHSKPLTDKTDSSIGLKLWSRDITHVSVSIEPDFAAVLGQLLRFNVEKILILTIFFNHILYLPKSYAFSILYTLAKAVLLLKDTALIYRLFPVELFCLLCAIMAVTVVNVLLKPLLFILMFMCRPLTYLLRNKESVPLFAAGIPILGLAFIEPTDIFVTFSFLTLFIVNLTKLSLVEDSEIKLLHTNILIVVIPNMLLFNAIPLVVFVKDLIEGTNSLASFRPFENLHGIEGLLYAYTLYTIKDFTPTTATPTTAKTVDITTATSTATKTTTTKTATTDKKTHFVVGLLAMAVFLYVDCTNDLISLHQLPVISSLFLTLNNLKLI